MFDFISPAFKYSFINVLSKTTHSGLDAFFMHSSTVLNSHATECSLFDWHTLVEESMSASWCPAETGSRPELALQRWQYGEYKNNLPRSQTPVSTHKPWAEFCHRGTAHPSQAGISGPCEHTPLFLKSFQWWSSVKMSPFYSLPELLQKYDKAQSTLPRFLEWILNGQS